MKTRAALDGSGPLTADPTRPGRRRAVAKLVMATVVVGVAAAGAALPVIGGVGLTVRAAADGFNALPADLEEPPLPQRSVILAADGTKLGEFYLYNRVQVDLKQVATIARNAVLAAEDQRFYARRGLDWRGLARASSKTAGGEVQGGSTLTQQYVKNVRLLAAQTDDERQEATKVTLDRKLRELRLALALERRYSKDEIFTRYLNIAYFGEGAYGIEAAAQRYFGVPAKTLRVGQAATLAGVLKNPSGYDPVLHPQAAKERRNVVLAQMRSAGAIDAETYQVALASRLGVTLTPPPGGCESGPAPFYCQWVRARLLDDPALGPTAAIRRQRLAQGGLVIHTGLDPLTQFAAQRAADTVPRDNPVATAVVVEQPGTGVVKAMAVNRDYGQLPGQTELPLPTLSAFQGGSTFKVFTLTTAVDQGIPLSTVLPAGNFYVSPTLDNPPPGFYRNAADGEGANLSIPQATWNSVNTAFVQLEERVGVLEVADMARKLGLTNVPAFGRGVVEGREGSFTLGTRDVSPLDMATAYATLAAHGLQCDPMAAVAVTDVQGHPVAPMQPRCRQVIRPSVADTVTSVLTGVVNQGTGRNAAIGRPAAGKTGTTQSFGAAWFVGYTPQLAAAVWMGDPRGPAYPLRNVLGYAQVYGGDIPARIWRQVMTDALTAVPAEPFIPGPAGAEIAPAAPRLPSLVGLPVAQAQAVLRRLGLGCTLEVVPVAPAAALGVVVDTVPAPGTRLVAGLPVRLRYGG